LRGLPGPEVRAGFLMGSDGIIWGREVTSTEPDTPRQLFVKKHWYSFMMWGRLAYEPDLPDRLFRGTLDVRFPTTDPGGVYAAFAAASRIVPQVNRFFWAGGGNDLAWFPEACSGHPSRRGFYTVREFMNGTVMPGSEDMNIRDYVAHVMQGGIMEKVTPVQVAEALRRDADQTLELLRELPRNSADKELRLTLGDLEAMAYLGRYYSDKILGATELGLLNSTGESEHRQWAIRYLQFAVEDWRRYAAVATRQYKPQLLTRIGYVDLDALTAKVQQDVEIARDWQIAR
jgi:hypothetical protein